MTTSQQTSRAACDARVLPSPAGTEVYLTLRPGPGDVGAQAEQVYRLAANLLREHGAAIVQERLFLAGTALPTALAVRAAALGNLEDGVGPTVLDVRGESGPLLGLQVQAVAGIGRPAVLRSGGVPVARLCSGPQGHCLVGSGLGAAGAGDGPSRTARALEAVHDLLTQAGAGLNDLARTWIWMDDILGWYPQLNQVRTQFFTRHGLVGRPGAMPASTGIGVAPAGSPVALDFVACWGRPDAVTRYQVLGRQGSAYAYGSAFARAARALTPGGTTCFCSGTAAIDTQGRTCCVEDIPGQVAMTLDNVRAVLDDLGCTADDVVQAMAYCASPQVQAHFLAQHRAGLPWPCLTMPGTVCRGDLLFEVEVTACPGAQKR